MASLIDVSSLTYDYGTKRALDNLDLKLDGGHIVGLLGENGCGKTTLLKVLAGVLTRYDGTVQIAGSAPGADSKAKVAFLPDESPLPRANTVDYFFDYFTDFYPDFDRDKASELLRSFGLDASMKLTEMSKGMREKVQVALTMGRQANVYLLDEPISGVDPVSRDAILKGILRDLREDSLVVISTHLIHDLEPVLDHVVMMRAGKVVVNHDVDDLRADTQLSIDQIFKETYAC